jgi:hypothetical protein
MSGLGATYLALFVCVFGAQYAIVFGVFCTFINNGSFFGMEDKSPMVVGTTDRGRLVSRQKTAVFLPRKPDEALY